MASFAAVGGVLAQRNARIFYSGSVVCWTGSWVQRIATDWMAWTLTHSTLWVGVIAFCNLVPSVVISPIAGAVADRMDRVKLTMASQYVAMSQSIMLVVLILTGTIRIEFMALLSFCNGAAETFAQPARQCLIPGLVPRQYLPGAVALNSLTYNVARFVGPAISGPMIAAWGVVPSIAVNARGILLRQRDDDDAAAGSGGADGRPRRRLGAARRAGGLALRNTASRASARCCCSPPPSA